VRLDCSRTIKVFVLFAALNALAARHCHGQVPWCKPTEVFNRFVPSDSKHFFVLELECVNGVVNITTFWQDASPKSVTPDQEQPLWRNASPKSVTPDREQPYKFDVEYKNGLRATIVVREARVADIGYDQAEVQLFRGASPLLHFFADAKLFYSIHDHSCWGRVTGGGMADDAVAVRFPLKLATRVAEVAQRNNWEAESKYGNEVFARIKSCKDNLCGIYIDVGSGNNFAAASEFNRIGSGTCAFMLSIPAGGPPVLVAGIPLGTLANPASSETSGLSEVLRKKLLDKIFSEHVVVSNLHLAGPGKFFSVSVLAPNRELRVTMKPGYWYKADLSLRIGLNVFGGEFSETLQITVLDLTEIRAPEDIPALPSGILESGRELKYLDSRTGDRSADGKTIDDWTSVLATKASDAIGGYVER
jgi:hypothetical protein